MEPNVDRGMWSVVVLLAAIVIGGVVLLAFPKISGKIVGNMNESVDLAFKGETPKWVVDNSFEGKMDQNDDIRNAVAFLKDAKKLELSSPKKPTFYTYFEGNEIHEHVVGQYNMDEWGVKDASKIKMTLGKRREDTKSNMFYLLTSYADKPNKGVRIVQLGLLKNEGEGVVKVANNSTSKITSIKPGETKLIVLDGEATGHGYLQTHFIYQDQEKTNEIELTYYGFAITDPSKTSELDKLLADYNIKK